MLYVLLFIILMVLLITLFVILHPTFGGFPSQERIQTYNTFENFSNGKFINQEPTNMRMSFSIVFSLIKDSMKGKKDRHPKNKIPISNINWKNINSSDDHLIWFGHSTFLLSMDGKKILIDPMFGPAPSPLPFGSSKRYSKDLLYIVNDLPPIDAVLLTHDHYDHLDYPSILKLKDQVGHFFVPHGVAVHLHRWGIPKDKTSELNWWDEVNYQGLTMGLVPSQHFSGRGFSRDKSLWGGWVIIGEKNRLYTSGDGGYGPHFKQIGEKYGPFDLTLIEGGQYDARWSSIHMMPEQSVQAYLDVKGKQMMLVHWGAFTLAFHSWTDPIERAKMEAERRGVSLITPKIGEMFQLKGDITVEDALWWKNSKL